MTTATQNGGRGEPANPSQNSARFHLKIDMWSLKKRIDFFPFHM